MRCRDSGDHHFLYFLPRNTSLCGDKRLLLPLPVRTGSANDYNTSLNAFTPLECVGYLKLEVSISIVSNVRDIEVHLPVKKGERKTTPA